MGKNLNASRLIDGLYVDASGNVGVNTTSPSYKFDVSGQARLGNSVAQSAPSATDILSTAHTILGGTGENYLTIGQYTSANGYAQWIQSSYLNPTTAKYNLVLNPLGGNVGIGTSSPSNILELKASSSTNSIVLGTIASTGGYNMISLNGTNAEGQYIGIAGGGNTDKALYYQSGNAGAHIFRTGDGTNFTERMRITSGGNILIGTTSDNGTKLQISGGANISGGVSIGSSITTHSGTLANVSGSAQFLFAFDTSRTRAGIFTAYSPNGSGNYYMTCQIDNRGGAMTAQTILGNAINITFSGNNVYITTSNSQTVNTWYWTFLYLN